MVQIQLIQSTYQAYRHLDLQRSIKRINDPAQRTQTRISLDSQCPSHRQLSSRLPRPRHLGHLHLLGQRYQVARTCERNSRSARKGLFMMISMLSGVVVSFRSYTETELS
jgi:hypothetical protein